MLLMIDNYDSFTYNLVQYFQVLGQQVCVRKNDNISLAEIASLNPGAICLSPGPGTPRQAGITLDAIHTFAGKIPILGICLGHQAIGQAFGGRVIQATNIMHGKTSQITHDSQGVFSALPPIIKVTRYHSLALERSSLPDCLQITAQADDGEIMGIRHRFLPIAGLQFHPESILSEHGQQMLANFLQQ